MPASRSSSQPRWWRWLGLAMLVLLADQLSKAWIVGAYHLGDSTRVSAFFNLVRVHNHGAAFSMLADASGWQRWFFTALGLGAAAFMLQQLRRHAQQKLYALALACLLGGALGNVLDRLLRGHVIDFLDFHWAGYHFPAFNLADSAISLGAACLLLDELLRVRRGR